ncbi:MAG: flagellar biosynthesis protein FlhA [Deltaproteobacteria bacterium]|nr:flagellar biosynthesis protein FlhA [Deltaproteobacteria bacterium]
MDSLRRALNRILKHSDLLIAAGVLGVMVVMILPIPAWLMDLLIVSNLTLSITILLVAVYSGRPLDFSVFPTVLLFSTLFRLAINMASTRLVLLHGHEGTAAAGHVIETFGNFVVGGSYIVGLVVFVILIIINFVVITKGSGRVAEVAARFILDAMPGKQMAIDADLNAGLITQEQAKERRRKVELEADFYGAMDGASKFVRGDAIAAILITLINIIGGFAYGVFQQGLEVGAAAQIYTLMTIGDGLVSQIPSLIVSTASGIVVTRATSGENLSKAVATQLLLQPRAIGVTAGILFLLGALPGIPTLPFWFFGFIVGGLAYAVRQHKLDKDETDRAAERKQIEQASNDTNVPPEVDVLELQVGYGLVSLVESEKCELVERIFGIRREFAKELGIIVPKVRIKDNLELQPTEYAIMIRGISVGKGELIAGMVLAMNPGTTENTVNGIETKEPVFGISALWIPDKNREKAHVAGFTVVDHPTIIATHLSEVIRKYASELIGRQEMQVLVENTQKTHPKVVEELIPNVCPLGTVLKVCQNLLKEQVPVRDLLTILETLANFGPSVKDPDVLTEYCRAALARTITHKLSMGTNTVEVLNMSPATEETLLKAYQKTDRGVFLNLEPGFFEKLVLSLQRTIESTVFESGNPTLLVQPHVRGHLRKMLERFVPNLNIISANEIASFAKVRSLATVEV